MANETVHADGVNIDALLDDAIMEHLRAQITVLNWVHRVSFERGSDSKKLRKRGSFTATTAAEATPHAKSQYKQVHLGTLAVQEVKVYAELSDKGRDFSMITVDEMAIEGALAVMDKVEQDACGLFDGFSTDVGLTLTALNAKTLRRALYNLRVNNVPGPYVFVLHPTQIDDVQDHIQDAGAANWGNPNVDFSILNGAPIRENGLAGSYLQVPVYSTTNVEGINTDDDWCGAALNPMRAIAFGEDGRGIRSRLDEDIEAGVTQIAVSMFYDVEEREDEALVQIISAQ